MVIDDRTTGTADDADGIDPPRAQRRLDLPRMTVVVGEQRLLRGGPHAQGPDSSAGEHQPTRGQQRQQRVVRGHQDDLGIGNEEIHRLAPVHAGVFHLVDQHHWSGGEDGGVGDHERAGLSAREA